MRRAPLFDSFDMLVIQLDADVAEKRYADDQRIAPAPTDLPCNHPCPPPEATTNALRRVLLGWMGEVVVPPKTVLCTPSREIETWLLVALFPANQFAHGANLECHDRAPAQLQVQPLKSRLIRGGKKEIGKYQERASDIASAWSHVRARCSEAERFSVEFTAAVPP